MRPDELSDDTSNAGGIPELGAPPASLVEGLGDRAELMLRYAQELATSGTERGLIGPREVPRLWDRHIVNCLGVAELIPTDVRVADVGTGAGLPGVVLAIARPDVSMTLIEPLLRRTVWLEEVVADLQLTNVTVERARAESLHGKAMFHVVTSRAVAPLGTLAAWCLPLLERGGRMLALKGRSAEEELAGATKAIRKAGGGHARVLLVGAPEEPTTIVEIERR